MLSVATVQAETHKRYVLVRVSLENQGASVVKPGTLLGRQTSTDGAVRHVEFRNSNSINPGGTTRVSQLLSTMSELELTAYRQSDGLIIPFSGGILKRLSFLRSVEVEIARWWNDVLVPRATSIVQVVSKAMVALDTAVVRWCGEVLVPRSRSAAGSVRAWHDNVWTRLAIDRRIKHSAEVTGEAWRSINAKLIRWQDDILVPRTRSIAARFKSLHENGWLGVADAKQRRKHRDEVEREAWESADAEIMRWWYEVLLPRSRSVAVRTKETLWHNKWFRVVATEIQRRVELSRTRRSLRPR